MNLIWIELNWIVTNFLHDIASLISFVFDLITTDDILFISLVIDSLLRVERWWQRQIKNIDREKESEWASVRMNERRASFTLHLCFFKWFMYVNGVNWQSHNNFIIWHHITKTLSSDGMGLPADMFSFSIGCCVVRRHRTHHWPSISTLIFFIFG